MSLNVAVLREKKEERRVAISPHTVRVLKDFSFFIERGAGIKASWNDQEYKDAGAMIVDEHDALKESDILLCVGRPPIKCIERMKEKSLLVGFLEPWRDFSSFSSVCTKKNLSLFALEFLPRISRAQGMDALSSQNNLAGYRVIIEAASRISRIFPMMMTAAGTLPPVHVFVMGTGVAGLQALATAGRLGSVTSATDIRPETQEQTESLGATFVAPKDGDPHSQGWKKQRDDMISEHISKQDIVISTALILGKSAPKIIDETLLRRMKPGSIIMDMAAIDGGNCVRTQPGKTIIYRGVTIVGKTDYLGAISQAASTLYGNNLKEVLRFLYPDPASKKFTENLQDDILKNALLMHKGHNHRSVT